jgi:transglutaminase-like putative cysteine protease
MRYQITHTTTYTYPHPVRLDPHILRLRPRSDGWQTLEQFSVQVLPEPMSLSHVTDLDGNALIKLWFEPEKAEKLTITTASQVETHQDNPFNYLLEPWALCLPIDYPSSLQPQLQPYLGVPDPIAHQLAQELWLEAEGNSTVFLNHLNQRIYDACGHLIRETGDPLPPTITWTHKQGSCRDFAVLFIHACKAVGLAARFVSGYQEGDLDSDDRHLHAWVEVYLPGAGWRGYDPTHGLAVADRHIALVASADSKYAAPVTGHVSGLRGAPSVMEYDLTIQRLD